MVNASVGKRDQVRDGPDLFPFVKRDAVAVFDGQLAGGILVVGHDFLFQPVQEKIDLVLVSVFKQRKKFIASVASYETQIYGRKIQHI